MIVTDHLVFGYYHLTIYKLRIPFLVIFRFESNEFAKRLFWCATWSLNATYYTRPPLRSLTLFSEKSYLPVDLVFVIFFLILVGFLKELKLEMKIYPFKRQTSSGAL